MVNRWQGNTGKHIRIEEPVSKTDDHSPDRYRQPRDYAPAQLPQNNHPRPQPTFSGRLSNLLSAELSDLETEDIILLLILYLMYRESGDSELLIIMGAMFLL